MSRGHGRRQQAILSCLKRNTGTVAMLAPKIYYRRKVTRSQIVSLRRALAALAKEGLVQHDDESGFWSLAPKIKLHPITLKPRLEYKFKYVSTGRPTWRDEDPRQLELDFLNLPHDLKVAEGMALLRLIGPVLGRQSSWASLRR